MKLKKRIIGIVLAIAVAFTFTTSTVCASVNGITKDNYMDYVKPYADQYGYNIGECDRPYLDGEEYFYDEYTDHWNVDKVYDKSLIPQAETKVVVKKTTKKVKTTNESVARAYCKKYCINYKVKIVKENKVPKVRKNKKYVYIEKVKTKSCGKYGKTKDGYKVRYIKPIKKGKTEYVYLVWNPKNNADDDVICFVSNKKFRGDKKRIKR